MLMICNGTLGGGSPCHVSILRNVYVACLCRSFMPLSLVEFKKRPCHMSNLVKALSHVNKLNVTC